MTTEQRLARLERENRWTKGIAVALALALGVVLFVAAGQDQEKDKLEVLDEVRAKSFVLVDEDQRTRGKLDVGEGSSRLTLFDAAEKALARISTTASGSSALCLYDPAGKIRVALSYMSKAAPTSLQDRAVLTLADRNAMDRAMLVADPDGGASLVFPDESQNVRASFGISHIGWPELKFGDDKGTCRAQFALSAGSMPVVRLNDGKGRFRAGLELLLGEVPALRLHDENKKVGLTLAVGPKTESEGLRSTMPQILLYDRKHTKRVAVVSDPDEKDPPLTIYDKDGKVTFQAPR
jgi:hypothetical protein